MALTTNIYANVLSELLLNTSNTTYISKCIRWLNKTMFDIESVVPNSEFLQKSESYLDTVADQATYMLPADFFELRSLRDDTNNNIISPVTREQFDRNHPDPSSENTGEPYEYTMEFDRTEGRSLIRLSLIPNDTYRIYMIYRAWHPTLTAQQNPIFDRLETVLEQGATWYGSVAMYKEAEYESMRNNYKMMYDRAMFNFQAMCMGQKPTPRQIPCQMRKDYSTDFNNY